MLQLPRLSEEAGPPISTPKTSLSHGFADPAQEARVLKTFQRTINAVQTYCNKVLQENQAKLARVGTKVQWTMACHKHEMATHCKEYEAVLQECQSAEQEMHSHFKARMEEAELNLWNKQRQKMAVLCQWGEFAMKVARTLQAKPENVKLLQWIRN